MAIAAQIAGITVPILIHNKNYGEYRWLISNKKEVSNTPKHWRN